MTSASVTPAAVAGATDDRRSERRLAFWLVSPAVVLMLAVTAYPIVYAVWLSLQRYNLAAPDDVEFIGLGNYQTILTDQFWWTAFVVTLGITVVSVAIEFVLGMALALVMHRTIFGRGVVRTAILDPVRHRHRCRVLQLVLRVDAGHRLSRQPAARGHRAAHRAASVAGHRGARRGVEDDAVHGAAPAGRTRAGAAGSAERGAGRRRGSRGSGLTKVILPLIKPAILVALLFRTLDAFRIFDNIYVLTGGANDTGSVSILGYDNLFKAFNLGLGSAISVLVFLSVAVIAFIYIKIFGASAPGSDEGGR